MKRTGLVSFGRQGAIVPLAFWQPLCLVYAEHVVVLTMTSHVMRYDPHLLVQVKSEAQWLAHSPTATKAI